MKKYYSHLSRKSLIFLKWCLDHDLISKKDILFQFGETVPTTNNHSNIAAAKAYLKPACLAKATEYKKSTPAVAKTRSYVGSKPQIAKVSGGED
ncbi:MAG: hypothetical protein ABIA21_00660 [Candidatus Aenigmatarchaeota archaeon]